MKIGPFTIDDASSDEESLFIDIEGAGTVVINLKDDGIAVSIFPLHIVDEPVAETWALFSELFQDEKEE
jgi:hypothetical protein